MPDPRPPATRPNPRIVAGAGPTVLTYALRTDPAPLTASISGTPVMATLQLVITNPHPTPVSLAAIQITLQIGANASDLATGTGTGASVSDPLNWAVSTPSGPVPGPAHWRVRGATGHTMELPANASLQVSLAGLPVNEAVGTTTVSIVEELANRTRSDTTFEVTKFPYGFFFDGLIATLPSGSDPVPVAQVLNGERVKLIWNCSVVEPRAFTVLYATNGGQQAGTVSIAGEWTSLPLVRDAVFVVQVGITGPGGVSLTFALATAVAVQRENVVADTVQATRVQGQSVVGSTVQANMLSVMGLARLSGEVEIEGSLSAQATTVSALNVTGNLEMREGLGWFAMVNCGYLNAKTGVWAMLPYPGTGVWVQSPGGGYSACLLETTHSRAIEARNNSATYPTISARNAGGGPTSGAAFYGEVAHADGWGFCTDGRIGSTAGSAHFTQVATHAGLRAATSPLSLNIEVHASGTARLSGGRARVDFDDAFADLVVPDGDYRVLATPLGRCGGVYVAAKEARGFLVESGDAEADAEFDWLVVAPKRHRLESAERHEMPTEFPSAPPAVAPAGPPLPADPQEG